MIKMKNNNPLYTMVKTNHKTFKGQSIYIQQWYDGTKRYKVRCRSIELVPKGKLYKAKSVDLDPMENERLFESDPYAFNAFVTSIMRICKWIMHHYMEYRQRGLSQDRAFNKAVINYEECHNSKLDGVWLQEAYDIVKAAEDGLETQKAV
jgi:hypothetical protein